MEQLEFDCRLESERELEENVNIALEFACKQVKETSKRSRTQRDISGSAKRSRRSWRTLMDTHWSCRRCWMRKPLYRPSTQCDESTMAFRRRPETSRSRDSGQISVCITHSFAFSSRSFCIAPIHSAADAYQEKERTEQRPRSRSGSGRIRSIPSTS